MRYFNHSPDSIHFMLKTIGKKSLDELVYSIPSKLRVNQDLTLPSAMDELQLKQEFTKRTTMPGMKNFIGAGATQHFVPEWVSQQLLRAEWYTSYTPYQPEVSQGTLQAIFEFQSMVASLFGLEIANGSMYDGATALVEALLMAIRITGKKNIAICQTLHPEYRATLKTYLEPIGVNITEIPFNSLGVSDLEFLESLLKSHELAAVAFSSPNFFGRIEMCQDFHSLLHSQQTLLIACTTDPSACALWPSFGFGGADIAVGEGLGFVGSLNLGGPGVGLLASKKAFLRQIPGRLVGYTNDKRGHSSYCLTLSTREQHIRREKATSNICTNHNLCALAFAMSMSAYGKSGLKNLAMRNIKKTLLFRKYLRQMHVAIEFNGPHYNESVINLKNDSILDERLAEARKYKLAAGLKLSRFYPSLAGHLLVNTTELHSDQDIKKLATILSGASHE
ncbi:MAG: aminomethyl-transferring glycine dehydrogenase subunit GcvPA [Myxococcales bacterium]|nr:aminomethyl-transferring glycine dehydrogenase subunit GcvPA [Myxococcales bacterium]USN50376.1 MAG: aminomethyl-transferring glycine dehydrogenase subunit GcvPA [Myxococcales bacterium]